LIFDAFINNIARLLVITLSVSVIFSNVVFVCKNDPKIFAPSSVIMQSIFNELQILKSVLTEAVCRGKYINLKWCFIFLYGGGMKINEFQCFI
jgi:hypothetical protein